MHGMSIHACYVAYTRVGGSCNNGWRWIDGVSWMHVHCEFGNA